MVATDLHYIDPVYFEGSDRLARSAAYGDGKMPHYSEAWLNALVLEALDQAPDALVLLGDLSYNGEVLSHKAIAAALARIEAGGVPVLVIPGNHDLNNDNAFAFLSDRDKAVHSLPPSRYAKYYGDFGEDIAFTSAPDSFSYAVALPDAWLILLDGGIFEPFAEPFGLITAQTQAWLEAVLLQAADAQQPVLTASHQSLLPHGGQTASNYRIVNGDAILPSLRSAGVRLHLSGHIHVHHIAEDDSLYDIALSAFSCYPHQYGLVTVSDDGAITYATHTVREGFLPPGLYTESRDFFTMVNYEKALASLRDSEADQAERVQMATYAAEVNRHFYAGETSAIHEVAIADEALVLWQAYAENAFWTGYLLRILSQNAYPMHALSLPALAK